jgi:hypothetical protein
MRDYDEDRPESTDWPDERWTLSDPCGCDWTDEEQFAREGLVMAHVEPGDAHDDLMERCPTCGERGCVGYCDCRDLTDADEDRDAIRPCASCGEVFVDVRCDGDVCRGCARGA